MRTTMGLTLLAAMLATTPVRGHYNMLLPDKHSVKKGEKVTFTYQWGHPFEHQLFDAPAPESLTVWAPDGKETDLTKSLEKTTVPADDKKVTAYRFDFTPDQRGDYVFVLKTPPIWMEEDGEFVQDAVRVTLHVQGQKGWDLPGSGANTYHLVPLTRPYGLQPGMVFQAQFQRFVTSPTVPPLGVANRMVEIERYNPSPPKELPADEHVTRTAKTDPGGVVTATLTDAGWWALTASRKAGEKERDGKKVPVTGRNTLWVFVDEKLPAK